MKKLKLTFCVCAVIMFIVCITACDMSTTKKVSKDNDNDGVVSEIVSTEYDDLSNEGIVGVWRVVAVTTDGGSHDASGSITFASDGSFELLLTELNDRDAGLDTLYGTWKSDDDLTALTDVDGVEQAYTVDIIGNDSDSYAFLQKLDVGGYGVNLFLFDDVMISALD